MVGLCLLVVAAAASLDAQWVVESTASVRKRKTSMLQERGGKKIAAGTQPRASTHATYCKLGWYRG